MPPCMEYMAIGSPYANMVFGAAFTLASMSTWGQRIAGAARYMLVGLHHRPHSVCAFYTGIAGAARYMLVGPY